MYWNNLWEKTQKFTQCTVRVLLSDHICTHVSKMKKERKEKKLFRENIHCVLKFNETDLLLLSN